MSVVFTVALTLLVSYLLGCFNGSVMTSHFIIRDDVRQHGSGNAGLTNFYRTFGGAPGMPCASSSATWGKPFWPASSADT